MPASPLARAVLVLGLGLAVLALGLAAWLWSEQKGGPFTVSSVSSSGTALVGGPFQLTDQSGQTRNAADFKGQWMLVYFGYTYCPDFCPSALTDMSRALDQLAESDPALAAQVVPVFITVDPERDTVEALAAYAPHFHERLVALTGSADQVAQAAGAYRVYYAKAEDGAASDYLMDHTTFVYLMDPTGAYATHFSHGTKAPEMAQKIAQLADQ